MQRILSDQLTRHTGGTVRIAGWVHRRRLLKSVAFLIVRDAAGLAQVVVTDPRCAPRSRRCRRRQSSRWWPPWSRTRRRPAGWS
ncbi:hypothetical protein GCM10029963_65940 [Micromonospora andamanensis]